MNALYIKRADTTIIYDPDAKGPVSLMVGDIRVRGEYKTKSSLSPELLSLLLSGLKPEYKKWDYENINFSYIKDKIIPLYSSFDSAHQIDHVKAVMHDSIEEAKDLGVSETLSLVAAAYHDIGLVKDRKTHHLVSGEMMRKDEFLNSTFPPDIVSLIAEAAEDHRASSSSVPRSIFGAIVADSDRQLETETVIMRTIQYSMSHGAENLDQVKAHVFSHMAEKYSKNGYLSTFFPSEKDKCNILQLHSLSENEKLLSEIVEKLWSKVENF